MNQYIRIIGAGLAGCEAALYLAGQNQKVKLYDMKPQKKTQAHHCDSLAELVCSNSLKSLQEHTASGLQKKELEILESPLLTIAKSCQVPAGNALAVDRDLFAKKVSEAVYSDPNIEFVSEEIHKIPNDEIITIIATGPLTSDTLFNDIQSRMKSDSLYFYDAAAPIVAADSIDMSIAYKKSRYDKGTADYINCPFNQEEYEHFCHALVEAELAELSTSDKQVVFEGCMPIETMAKRGNETLRFGPLKPVGLINPHDDSKPYAVVQLRQENQFASMYNLVGFQTRLKWPEQKRVFRMIPGLKNAEFLRYGVMHRNSYIASDNELTAGLQLKREPRLFFAGQITGLEGYLCAMTSGNLAARNAMLMLQKKDADFVLPEETISGQLTRYISSSTDKTLQPMNANFGLLPTLNERIKNKQERGAKYAERSLQTLHRYLVARNER